MGIANDNIPYVTTCDLASSSFYLLQNHRVASNLFENKNLKVVYPKHLSNLDWESQDKNSTLDVTNVHNTGILRKLITKSYYIYFF